ncbi:ProQ/FINO family protein [Halomonas sp. YLGW01]|uniref:ProQ/FINO family protein n=1 Tax=Halomonas sp. YLGW01 TaxID=2773308 RepID=UPI001F5B26ED|nr:ProQ/FINO family protein [Halomonas sp. YLGW01]
MNNERTAALLATLEACAEARLEELAQARARVAALVEQNRRLEARSHELEIKSRELETRSHELETQRRRLESKSRELEQQHDALTREHQALGETCRELEEKFARAPHTADGHAHPRSQGLAALLSHRARPESAAAQATPHPPSTSRAAPSRSEACPEAQEASGAVPLAAASPEADSSHTDRAPSASAESQARARQAQANAQVQNQSRAPSTDSSAEPAPDASGALASEQGSPSTGEVPSPQALLNQWYRRYPDAFFKGHVRPLRVGIHEDLLAREPWPEKLVRRALACYVHLPRYLKAVRQGAERVGLDGEAAGPVSEGEARYARKKLDELRAQQQAERRKAGRAGKKREGGKVSAAGKTAAAKSSAPDASSQKSPRPGTSSPEAPASDASSKVPSEPSSQEAPGERMERKLGALLAKHGSR